MKPATPARKRPRRPDARRDWMIGAAAALVLVAALVLGAVLARPRLPLQGTEAPDALAWSELRPPHTQVLASASASELARLRDADPRAAQLLRRMRDAGDSQPPVAALDGRAVALLGYVVPLDGQRGPAFLLVPYFGACIHSPPPPANQVVHVTGREALRVRTMDRVLVRGVIRVEHGAHEPAASGYAMRDADVVLH